MRNLLTFSFILIACCASSAIQHEKHYSLGENSLPAGMTNEHFRKNNGQWNDSILYQTDANGIAVRYLKNGISMAHTSFARDGESNPAASPSNNKNLSCLVWNMHFLNSNENASIKASRPKNSNTNYMRGNDFSRHVINAKDYEAITYQDIYPDIDMAYYRMDGRLKYDYIIKPGGSPKDIQLYCGGIKEIALKENGELEITNEWGTITERTPYAYQIMEGKKKEIKVNYKIINNFTFGFEVISAYDPSLNLVIDPITLEWATYVGGPGTTYQLGTHNSYLCDIALDAAGNVYGTGAYTDFFPTTPGVYDTSFNGETDIFVFKLSNDGSTLLWASYIGGSGYDITHGIAVNSNDDVFLVGRTLSTDFPTINAIYPNFQGGSEDVVVLKLINNGTQLAFSTYLGGNDRDYSGGNNNGDMGGSLAINSNDEIFITGTTRSSNFPVTAGAAYTSFNGISDGFVTKLSSTGTLVYSTFIGGSSVDDARAICINSNNEATITGATYSTNFPTTAGVVQAAKTPGGSLEIFVVRLNAAGSLIQNSTYMGKGEGWAIKTDAADNIYVTGMTTSGIAFPTTPGAYMTNYTPTSNIGVAFKLNSNFSTLVFSTFLANPGQSSNALYGFGTDIAVNASEEVFVTGYYLKQSSGSFPTVPCAYQQTSNTASSEIFLMKFNPTASTLLYSTILGGSVKKSTNTVSRIDSSGSYASGLKTAKIELYGLPCEQQLIIGSSESTGNFETTPGAYQEIKLNPYQRTQPVVMKISPKIDPGFTSTPDICGNTIIFTDTTNPCGLWDPNSINQWLWDFGDGSTSTQQHPTHLYSASGTYNVKLKLNCPLDSIVRSITVSSAFSGTTTITANPSNTICTGNAVTLNAGGGTTYEWSNGNTGSSIQINPTSSSVYTVTIFSGSCSVKDSINITINPLPTVVFTANDTAGCASHCVIFSSSSSSGTHQWTLGDGNISNTETLSHCYSTAGDYTVKLTVTDANGCSDSLTGANRIHVYPAVTAAFDANPTITTLADPTITFTNQSTGADSYGWSFGDPLNGSSSAQDTQYTYSSSGIYEVKLIASNMFGCYDTTTTQIIIEEIETVLYIPNAFSPNGDGENDRFVPKGGDVDKSTFLMYIYDRWGNLIYETNDPSFGWDGNTKGSKPAQQAVYLWKIDFLDKKGSANALTGNVSLVR